MRAPSSYWMESTPWPEYPPLGADVRVDVVVIGAGVAGLSTAWELVRRGRRVALLEADRVAGGVTGHTTAKVSALHGDVYGLLTRRFGPEIAATYAGTQQRAMRHVAEVVAELGVDCDLESRPAYLYSETDEEAMRLEAEAVANAGLPAAFTTEPGLPFGVAGAVRVEDQLMFHPRKYLLALATDLVARGGLVHERARVTGLTEGEPCTVTTAAGHRVTADDVVVATHYPVFDRALLFARLVPHREFAVAGVIDAGADPRGMYITTAGDTRSVRSTPYRGRRLLIVTGEQFAPGSSDTAEHLDRLTGWMRDRFGIAEPDFVWAAQDNHSSDRLPFIGLMHPLARRTWVATGFGGWGMTNGVLSGMLLAELIGGEKLEGAEIYDPRRLHLVTEAVPVVKAAVRTTSNWAGSRIRARLRSSASAEDIAPGEAGVVTVGGDQLAVHRADDGTLHTVSAICTHLGCLIGFNAVEREWECPCHGSRFGLDGEVRQGPATAPLRRGPGAP